MIFLPGNQFYGTLAPTSAVKRARMQIFYSGRVQGVGFRYTVKKVVSGFEVTGTVRNLPDGRVELIAEGAKDELSAFRQGILTEVLNPKTALFFLSFIPQFVAPERGHVFLQFIVLGALSVLLNTAADLLVVILAAPLERKLKSSVRFRRGQRVASGLGMITLGTYVAIADTR